MRRQTIDRTPEQLRELESLYRVFALARTDNRLSVWVFEVRADRSVKDLPWSALLTKLLAYAASLKEVDKAA
jgi:hypothetical protein